VRRQFVVEQAQHPIIAAYYNPRWFAAAAGKLLFRTVVNGACLRASVLLAVAQCGRGGDGGCAS
jgi:hypothetical protein